MLIALFFVRIALLDVLDQYPRFTSLKEDVVPYLIRSQLSSTLVRIWYYFAFIFLVLFMLLFASVHCFCLNFFSLLRAICRRELAFHTAVLPNLMVGMRDLFRAAAKHGTLAVKVDHPLASMSSILLHLIVRFL